MEMEITEDIKYRASKGQLTREEQQQMRDEIRYYRRHLIKSRKILTDLLLENTAALKVDLSMEGK